MVANMDDEEQWEDVKSRKKRVEITNGFEEEPDFSDPDDYVDDISDSELLPDLLEKRPKEADGIDAVIVVDNVPMVGADRLPKLKTVISKIFSKFGPIHSDYYPEKDGKTVGYIFIEYEMFQGARDAVKGADLYKLDRSHTLRLNLFSDFDKYKNVKEEWTPPERQPFKDVGNLHYYLEEEDCSDQFSIIYEGGQKTAILLNSTSGPSVVEERPRWTETYTRWSPKGSYLATFHGKGIALWGGEKFKQIQRFAHPGVQLIDFSPCERYLVTFSPMPEPGNDEMQAVIIWEIFTGAKKRTFQADMSGDDDRQWPIFKWSHDGKYLARKAKGVLSVYETPSMGLLDKKSIAIDGISEFFWSPADNMLAFWIAERNEIPARVIILSIPSRKEVRVKNLFNVADIRLNWHKQGKFLCVKVDRYNKAKKANISNFEIFHIQEKQVPVDIVELKEQVNAFAWEPTGNKFCCLHGESPRISATFYEIKGGKVECLETMERKQASHIFWSPAGQFVLLAGLNSATSQLEFIDTSDMSVMNTGEHLMVSDIEWDPTGRYLVSIVSWWAHKIDNAYWVWSFQGRLLRKHPTEQLCQLLWRPRPPTLLNHSQIKKIRKEHKSYSKIFEAKDRQLQNRASKEIIEKRRHLMERYLSYRRQCREVYLETTPYRRELRNGVNTDEVDSHAEDWDEVTVEILLEEEDIVLSDKE
ncbi:eukaryotic translation initiation factor 3 subunit B-like [Clavelina lepadiformis]|uniref:eukaryotic translation initiation factor 3 subunit B-like n=1 Tax=Clavelina lepadiformis TaxID=159417 RepID=UPI0040431752